MRTCGSSIGGRAHLRVPDKAEGYVPGESARELPKELLHPVVAGLVAGSAHRQIARSVGCAASTVTRLAARLGRHSLLFQGLALEMIDVIDEPVVLDHFETFVFSQDDRLGIATPTGQRSWFTYAIEPATGGAAWHASAPSREGCRTSYRGRSYARP